MPRLRRQLTLFVPAPARELLEDLRRELDPAQHARIAAHVTLCREDELEPWDAVRSRLAALGPVEVELRFGAPVQRPDDCVLLPVVGDTAAFDDLRRRILGEGCRTQTPHVTIRHPRHAYRDPVDLEALVRESLPTNVRFTGIDAIEQIDGSVWDVVARWGGAR